MGILHIFKRKTPARIATQYNITEIGPAATRRRSNLELILYDIELKMRDKEPELQRTWPVNYDSEMSSLFLEIALQAAFSDSNKLHNKHEVYLEILKHDKGKFDDLVTHLSGEKFLNMKNQTTIEVKMHKVKVERQEIYRTPFETCLKDALKDIRATAGLSFSPGSANLSTSIGKWIEVIQAKGHSVAQLKNDFRSSGYSGSINEKAILAQRIIARFDVSGTYKEQIDNALKVQFEWVSTKMLENSWHDSEGLTDSVVVTYYNSHMSKADKQNMRCTMVMYIWQDMSMNYNANTDYTDKKLRQQARMVPYVTIENVPLWLVANIEEGEDTGRRMSSSYMQWKRFDLGGTAKATEITLESDDRAWEGVQQGIITNSSVFERLEDDRRRPASYSRQNNEAGCWVTGLQLNGCTDSLRRAYQRTNSALRATYPHMLQMQISARGEWVCDTPVAYNLAMKETHTLPIIEDAAGAQYTYGIGHINKNPQIISSSSKCYSIMRWNPEAVTTSVCTRSTPNSSYSFSTARNNGNYLWAI